MAPELHVRSFAAFGGSCVPAFIYVTSHCDTQNIKRAIDRRTVDLYALFSEELNLVKKEFTRQAPNLPASQPNYSGSATWARRLKRRIDTPMKVSQSTLLGKGCVCCACVYVCMRACVGGVGRRASYS